MGSDKFSVPSLAACIEVADVAAVFTQPDSRVGRGRKQLAMTPVKELALKHNIPVEQPEKFDTAAVERLRGYAPGLTVVAAYGKILPEKALEAAALDSINVHASILPRHRGASPIATAILRGDAETGVTIMKMRRGVDTGEIVCCEGNPLIRRTAILPDENTAELSARLAPIGADALRDAIACYQSGGITYLPQNDDAATHAKILSKEDGQINWSRPADEIMRQFRAMSPWPGAYTNLCGEAGDLIRIVLVSARIYDIDVNLKPGEGAIEEHSKLVVGTATRGIELVRVRPAGRGDMSAADFARGLKNRRLIFCAV